MKVAKWNYETCQAQAGTAIVGKCERPTYWHNGLEGQRRRVVRLVYNGDVFFIDDEDGSGSRKVFERGGGPDSSHKSIPVDDESTFIPDQEGK